MLNKDEMLARTSNGIACASLSYPLTVDTALFNRLAKSACVQPRLSLSEAQNLGIDADHAVKYRNTSTGVQKNFAAIAAYTRSAVQQQDDDSWKDNIEKDK